jgi:hypothetical protein
LEGGLNRLACEFACCLDGEGLDLGKDLAIRGGVSRLFELLGKQEGLLDDERLKRRLGMEGGALVHGDSFMAWGHQDNAS